MTRIPPLPISETYPDEQEVPVCTHTGLKIAVIILSCVSFLLACTVVILIVYFMSRPTTSIPAHEPATPFVKIRPGEDPGELFKNVRPD